MIPLSPAEREIEQEPTAPALKKGLFERVAAYQKVVVLLAGFAYAFGYASRALHAFENNLGALPGVRLEYLVAGTLLLIPPIALCLVLWGVWRSAKRLAAWAAKDPKRKAGVPNSLLGGFLLGMVTVVVLPDPVKPVGVFFGVGCFLYFATYLAAGGELPKTSDAITESASVGHWRKVLSWLGNAAIYLWGFFLALWIVLLLVLVFALAVLYGAIAVRHVPQEFGGVKPKCGVLDLSPEQLSAELRSLITASPGENLDSKVVRSRPLEIFSTSEPWLVRLPSPGVGVPPRSIRLDGKAVLSVEWCH
jgi:hypothetical protein